MLIAMDMMEGPKLEDTQSGAVTLQPTLWASLSSTFLKTLPDLVMPL